MGVSHYFQGKCARPEWENMAWDNTSDETKVRHLSLLSEISPPVVSFFVYELNSAVKVLPQRWGVIILSEGSNLILSMLPLLTTFPYIIRRDITRGARHMSSQ